MPAVAGPTIGDVVRRYGGEYLQRFGAAMPAGHKQVLRALGACRTGELGTVVYACSSCGRCHCIGRSCGNRHCPTCQQQKAKAWLEKQTARLLPCPYFLITFTVPAALRPFVRAHQRDCYAAMFAASSAALRELAADPKYVGTTRLGFFGVLHTWGRALDYHPHLHYVVPGGGLSADGSRWLPSRADFFVPVRALSILYRAKFREAMRQAGLLPHIDPAVWREAWITDCRAVGDGRVSLKYLAPYVFRVALSDRRIVSCDDGKVTFLVKPSGRRTWRKMTLDALEFLRRFLQHVLPAGFMKIRHYGFLSAGSRESIEAIRWLVTLHHGLVFLLLAPALKNVLRPTLACPSCGGELLLVGFVPPCRGPP